MVETHPFAMTVVTEGESAAEQSLSRLPACAKTKTFQSHWKPARGLCRNLSENSKTFLNKENYSKLTDLSVSTPT